MKGLRFHNKRHRRYLVIGLFTIVVLVVLRLLNPDFFGEEMERIRDGSTLGLWLIGVLLLLLGVLVYVSLHDYGKRSLIRIHITCDKTHIHLTVMNVSGEMQRFSDFEIQREDVNKTWKSKLFHLKEELLIENNKKWSGQLDRTELEFKDETDVEHLWIRIKFIGENGINYFSNKLRLI